MPDPQQHSFKYTFIRANHNTPFPNNLEQVDFRLEFMNPEAGREILKQLVDNPNWLSGVREAYEERFPITNTPPGTNTEVIGLPDLEE